MGSYEYYTKLNGAYKEIVILLGQDHEFDVLRNPIVVRDKIIDYKECTNPLRRWFEYPTALSLANPDVEITHNYGTATQIPLCSPVELRADIYNFPKNVAKQYKWQVVELNKPNGFDDKDLRISLNF